MRLTPEQDAVQALVERVAVVAVEEQERLAFLQLSPKVAKQFDLAVRFEDPPELFVLRVRFPDVELFVLADDYESSLLAASGTATGRPNTAVSLPLPTATAGIQADRCA